jgi:hypothetical protein
MKLFGKTQKAQKTQKKRGTAGLNHAIAYMHGLNNRLVGLQLTSGNVIGIVISAIQITFGALIVSHPVWYLDPVLAPITSALAVAIERLSLGGLGMVRRSVTKLMELADAHFEMQQVEQRKPTELEEHNYQRQKKIQLWTMVGGLIVVVLGVVISGFVGDQFWQWVWRPAGEPTSTILGIACAAVISLGFVYSELFKKPSDEEVEDRVNDDRIQVAVLKKAETDLQIGLSLEAFGNVRADADKKEQAVTRIEEVVQDRLEAYADRIGELAMGDVQQPLLNGPKDEHSVAALPAPTEQVEEHHVAVEGQEEQTEDRHAVVDRQDEGCHVAVDEQDEGCHAAVDEQDEGCHAAVDEQDEQEEERHVAPAKPLVVRSYYAQYRDVLLETLTNNPEATLKELGQVTHGCPETTLRRWKVRAKKELDQMAQMQVQEEHHVVVEEQADEHHVAVEEQVDEHHVAVEEQVDEHHVAVEEQVDEHHVAESEKDVAA